MKKKLSNVHARRQWECMLYRTMRLTVPGCLFMYSSWIQNYCWRNKWFGSVGKLWTWKITKKEMSLSYICCNGISISTYSHTHFPLHLTSSSLSLNGVDNWTHMYGSSDRWCRALTCGLFPFKKRNCGLCGLQRPTGNIPLRWRNKWVNLAIEIDGCGYPATRDDDRQWMRHVNKK